MRGAEEGEPWSLPRRVSSPIQGKDSPTWPECWSLSQVLECTEVEQEVTCLTKPGFVFSDEQMPGWWGQAGSGCCAQS